MVGLERAPAIVITRGDPSIADAEHADVITEQYAAAVRRAGGDPVVVTPAVRGADRHEALARMGGLVLSGGGDLDPALFGQGPDGARDVEAARDELEQEAWATARERLLPVLGICRGLQAINVFSGGRLVQHVEGHDGPLPGHGAPLTHRLRVASGTQLARILRPTYPGTFVLQVDSSHHQAVRAGDLAPGLIPSGWSPSPAGELVEAIEGRDPAHLVLALQCHPERVDTAAPEFERLFRFFVDAARHASRLAVRTT